jgi:hypothetical protein
MSLQVNLNFEDWICFSLYNVNWYEHVLIKKLIQGICTTSVTIVFRYTLVYYI